MIKGVVEDDITRQLELTEEYDQTYKLYDHASSKDLMSVMFLHPEEDPVTGSRLETYIDEIIALRLPEMMHEGVMSILENYPLWWIDKMLAKVRPIRKKEADEADGLKTGL